MPAIGELAVDHGWVVALLKRVTRKLRIEYPGAIYHVMSRGDRREPILPGRPGPDSLRGDAGGGLSQDGMAGPCVLPHVESLPPGGRDAPRQLGRWDEMVSGHVH